MTIKFYCDFCRQKIEAQEVYFGMDINCPGCKERITVPTLANAAAVVKENVNVEVKKDVVVMNDVRGNYNTERLAETLMGNSLLGRFFKVYFDIFDSIDSGSPYRMVSGCLHALYCICAFLLLVLFIAGIPASILIHVFYTKKFVFMEGLFTGVAYMLISFVLWFTIYVQYKFTRVIFDIAEYLRKIWFKM